MITLTEFFIDGLLISTLCIFGLIGNFLIIIIFCNKKLRTSIINYLLICLAISDSIILFITLFQQGIPTIKNYVGFAVYTYYSTSLIEIYFRTYYYFILNVGK